MTEFISALIQFFIVLVFLDFGFNVIDQLANAVKFRLKIGGGKIGK